MEQYPTFRTPAHDVIPPDRPDCAIGTGDEQIEMFAWVGPDRGHCGSRLHLDLRVEQYPALRTAAHDVIPPDRPDSSIGTGDEQIEMFAWVGPDRGHCGSRLHLDLRVEQYPALRTPAV